MSLVTTRAGIKYLSIKFFLKFFSVSWSRTHSENRESWNLPQPSLTNGSSLQKNYLCLKLFHGGHTGRIFNKKKLVAIIFLCLYAANEIAPPPQRESFGMVFCCLLVSCSQCWMHSGLLGTLHLSLFCLAPWFISGCLLWLGRSVFHLRGECSGKKMPWYSLWH